MISSNDIDAWLPQTQCQKCEYADCKSYADAILSNDADYNRCPPGGQATIDGLAMLLGKPSKSLDARLAVFEDFKIAKIVESECIGCTKCITACPVDAIVGSGKRMHTILINDCTGCELCLAPCPVDCIVMESVDIPEPDTRFINFPQHTSSVFRRARQRRVSRTNRPTMSERHNKKQSIHKKADIQNEILAAVERSKKRLKTR